MRSLFVAGIMAGILTGCSTGRGAATAASSDPLAPQRVAGGVYLLPGSFVPGHQPDGNSVLFEQRNGLIVVDTGRHAEHTQRILDFAHSEKRPVQAVVNTHWHLDHTGGNAAIRRESPQVRVWASGAIEGAMSGFLANYRKQLQEMISTTKDADARTSFEKEVSLIDSGRALYPDEVVTGSGPRVIAGKRLELHLEAAATRGDIWLFDPATRIVVAGDLVTLPVPFLDTACPARWSEALARLSSVDFKLLIPGHGPTLTRQEFGAYRRSFDALLACASTSAPAEDCKKGWIEGLGGLLPESERAFTSSLLDYYIDQQLRGDPARAATLCGS